VSDGLDPHAWTSHQRRHFIQAQGGTNQNLEGDGIFHLAVGAGQGADHLAVFFEDFGNLAEVGVEGGQVEAGQNAKEIAAFLEIFQQPMFFVFGENIEHRTVDVESGKGVITLALAPTAQNPLKVFHDRPDINGEIRGFALAVHQPPEDFQGLEQHIDQGLIQGHLAQTQAVKHAFHLMGEIGNIDKSEHSRQSLEGMRAAKNAVQQIGVGLAAVDRFGEFGQIGTEAFQDIFRLTEKFLERLRGFVCQRSLLRTRTSEPGPARLRERKV